MKKITFSMFFAIIGLMANSQNLVTNGGFEDAVSGYTVSESTDNVLMRVVNLYDPTTAATFPTATAAPIAAGQWVKKAQTTGDDMVKGVVTTTSSKSGSSSLNLKIDMIPTAGYDKYVNAVVSQKIATPLDNNKRYVVSFWAKLDATVGNNCKSVTVMIVDNTLKQVSYPVSATVFLTTPLEWTKYTVVLELPRFKSLFATADFTTSFLGFGINTTYSTDTPPVTYYAGVLLDDISMTEYTGPTVRYVKQNGTGDGSSWANATSDILTAMNQITRGEVRVAAGTYFPSASITLKDSVILKGGYDASGSDVRNLATNKTIIDGNLDKRIIIGNDFAAPFNYESKADGLILQRGNSDYGSAARLTLGSVLENCIIRNNTGTGVVGSAVYFNRNNRVPAAGSNKNYQCSGALINCVLINNSSNGGAGAVYGDKSTLFSVVNCVIANNACTEPTTGTGGLYIGNSSQFDHVQNCIFYKNSGATVALNNIRNNSTVGLYAVLNNWFDNPTVPITSNTDTRSICKNNYTATNIASPDFVLPTTFAGSTTNASQITEIENSNWRLRPYSGLLELGNSTQGVRYPYENMNPNTTATPTRTFAEIPTDIIGSPRISMTEIDLGAYEFNPYAAINDLKLIEDNNLVDVQGCILSVKVQGKVDIYSIMGKLIYSQGNNESIISVKNAGIYLVKVTDSQFVRVQKVIVR